MDISQPTLIRQLSSLLNKIKLLPLLPQSVQKHFGSENLTFELSYLCMNILTLVIVLALFSDTVEAKQLCYDETIVWDERRFNDCERRAKQGDSKAQYILSKMYSNSPVSNGTDHQAFIWTKKLADLGVIPAQIKLVEMYHLGRGIDQNDINAYTYAYIVSSNQHYHEDDMRKLKAELAKKLTTSQVKKAKISAVEWLVDTRQYSLGHDGFVYWVLAEIFRRRSDKLYAFEASLTAAALDNKDAQRLIVNMFQYDKELLGDISDKALDSIQKTAKEESRQQLVLGYMYFYGNTVPQSYTEALKWYIAAAQVSVHDVTEQTFTDYDLAINLVASHLLAWMYDTGQGVEQDYKQAFEWYKKAADAGYGDAQLRLAEMYQHGLGVEQNNQLTLEWYQTAAEQGYHKAQRVLANLYRTGTLLKQDSKLAFEWYKKAAVLEELPAQYALAELYYQGDGTAKDDVKAYMFADYLNQQYSHVEAKKLRNQIKKDMTSEQLEAAKNLQQQWLYDAKYRTLGVAVEPPFEW